MAMAAWAEPEARAKIVSVNMVVAADANGSAGCTVIGSARRCPNGQAGKPFVHIVPST